MPTLGAQMKFSKREIDATGMKKRLTLKFRDNIAEENVIIHGYKENKSTLSVPREVGIAYCQEHGIQWRDRTSDGETGVWNGTKEIELRDYQRPWVADLMRWLESDYDIRAQAATGMGKTVMSLEVARRLNTTTLVVVDQEFLRDQWIETATELFDLSPDKIGIVQGKKLQYEGKTLVVAMIQTLFSRDFDQDFLDHFGAVIFDECHTVGAPVFAKALGLFPAASRWGVSATPDRGDKKDKLIEWSLGPVAVQLQQEHKQSMVRYLKSFGVFSWYANSSPKTGRYINEVAEDMNRNRLMARAIVEMYGTGRTILCLSDRIEHLEVMKSLLMRYGIGGSDIGVVTRYHNRWRYMKDPKPSRQPPEWERGTQFTPVKMGLVSKRVKTKELDEMKARLPILLATYQMFSKGVDVPRLDTGFDLTPRSKAQQQHGRILRQMAGKKTPIWVTVVDVNSFRALFQFRRRLSEYAQSNVEVYEWQLDKGIRKRDPRELSRGIESRYKELESQRIVTRYDGRSMLQIQSMQRRPGSRPDRRTESPTRRRRAN